MMYTGTCVVGFVCVWVKNWDIVHQPCHVGDVDHAGIFFIVSQNMMCHVLCSLVGQNFPATHAVGT